MAVIARHHFYHHLSYLILCRAASHRKKQKAKEKKNHKTQKPKLKFEFLNLRIIYWITYGFNLHTLIHIALLLQQHQSRMLHIRTQTATRLCYYVLFSIDDKNKKNDIQNIKIWCFFNIVWCTFHTHLYMRDRVCLYMFAVCHRQNRTQFNLHFNFNCMAACSAHVFQYKNIKINKWIVKNMCAYFVLLFNLYYPYVWSDHVWYIYILFVLYELQEAIFMRTMFAGIIFAWFNLNILVALITINHYFITFFFPFMGISLAKNEV